MARLLPPTYPSALCPVLLPVQPGLRGSRSCPRLPHCQLALLAHHLCCASKTAACHLSSHSHGMLEGTLKIVLSTP